MDLGTITIADGLLILVTFLGPVVAIQVQKVVERKTESKARKERIFSTLMATRALRASNEHVQSLNLIELVFRGKSGKPVRDAWEEYFDLLEKGAATPNEPDVKMWNDKGNELLINLLSAMARVLNYDINRAQLKRGYIIRGSTSMSRMLSCRSATPL